MRSVLRAAIWAPEPRSLTSSVTASICAVTASCAATLANCAAPIANSSWRRWAKRPSSPAPASRNSSDKRRTSGVAAVPSIAMLMRVSSAYSSYVSSRDVMDSASFAALVSAYSVAIKFAARPRRSKVSTSASLAPSIASSTATCICCLIIEASDRSVACASRLVMKRSCAWLTSLAADARAAKASCSAEICASEATPSSNSASRLSVRLNRSSYAAKLSSRISCVSAAISAPISSAIRSPA